MKAEEKREITPGGPLKKMKTEVSGIMDKYIKEENGKQEEKRNKKDDKENKKGTWEKLMRRRKKARQNREQAREKDMKREWGQEISRLA